MDNTFQVYLDISIILASLGITANITALVILLKRRDLRTTWNIVNIPLNLSEILFDIATLTGLFSEKFFQLQNNTLKCTILGMMILMSSSFSSYSVVLISLERFRAICYGRPLKIRVWISILASILILATLFSALPFFDPLGYVVATSKTYCVAPWYGSSWISRFTSILAVLDLLLVSIFVSFFYLRIFQHYHKVIRLSNRPNVKSSMIQEPPKNTTDPMNFQNIKMSSGNASKFPPWEKKDAIILMKSVCYIVAFACLWMPYVLLIIVEMVTQQQANPAWHITASLFAEISTLVNPMIFILLSPAFLAEIKSWFSFIRPSG